MVVVISVIYRGRTYNITLNKHKPSDISFHGNHILFQSISYPRSPILLCIITLKHSNAISHMAVVYRRNHHIYNRKFDPGFLLCSPVVVFVNVETTQQLLRRESRVPWVTAEAYVRSVPAVPPVSWVALERWVSCVP